MSLHTQLLKTRSKKSKTTLTNNGSLNFWQQKKPEVKVRVKKSEAREVVNPDAVKIIKKKNKTKKGLQDIIAFKIGYVPVDRQAEYQFQHKQPFKNNRVMSSQQMTRNVSRLGYLKFQSSNQ